jgi:D-alanyl-D-alanine carboxypeptidase
MATMSGDRLETSLRASLEGLVAKGIVGASACIVRKDEEPVVATAGLADRVRRIPVAPTHLFKIGSVTKSFVAVTLMRLAEDGTMSLDAPIAAWFPRLPYADRITVRQLVNHRSGAPEFELHMPMEPSRRWRPQEIVDLAYRVGTPSEPGLRASYTNTGYVLAGMLIEALTGDSLAGQIRARVLVPLGLSDTYAAAGEAFPEERLVRGYYYRPPLRPEDANLPFDKGGEMWQTGGVLGYSEDLQDSTVTFPFSSAYAAGDIVATASDLARFIDGLFAGRILRPDSLLQMQGDRLPAQFIGTRMRETGAGLFALDYAGRQTFGHQGSMPGYVTVIAHEPVSGVSAALTTNTGTGNRLHFYATSLHQAFDEIIALVANV